METEEWRIIPGYEPYEASNFGRVRRGEKLRKPTVNRRGGYHSVVLGLGGRKSKVNAYVHQLVLFAFVGPRPNGLEAAHLNGDPADNRLANLRWVTHTENMGHQRAHGTSGRQPAKLSREKADQIRRLRQAQGLKHRELAERFGVAPITIWRVLSGGIWR